MAEVDSDDFGRYARIHTCVMAEYMILVGMSFGGVPFLWWAAEALQPRDFEERFYRGGSRGENKCYY